MSEQMFRVVSGSGQVLTQPMSKADADVEAIELSIIYKGLHLVPTDDKPAKQGFVANGPAEEVEDNGCASGACTL